MGALHFDPLETELGDIDVFEAITGKPFEEFDPKATKGSAEMKALYYLVMRQNDPDFAVESLAKVKVRDLLDLADAIKGVQPDPTTGEAEA
jgi:hypothetical protein